MTAFPAWTRLAHGESRVLVNYLAMLLPIGRSGAVAHDTVRAALETHLTSSAAKIAKKFVSTASQDDIMPCHTLLVETATSLHLEVYAMMTLPRTWFALASAVIRLYRCGTYAVNGGRRVIWVEFPLG